MRDWAGRHSTRTSRLRLHLVSLSPLRYASSGAPGATAIAQGRSATEPPAERHEPDVQALARLAVALKRYDACVLPVAPASLAWTRMALQQASAVLATPILLLVDDVKAPAIEDLLGLGASDFMMQHACLDSLRVRLGRLARPSACGGRLAGLREPGAAYPGTDRPGAASDGRSATPRPRVAAELVEQTLSGLRHQYHRATQEPFRDAKARVVDGFERDYIRLALSRHGGNVAQAARACSKHRRAFWALMRKHGIEAAPYRQAAQERDD